MVDELGRALVQGGQPALDSPRNRALQGALGLAALALVGASLAPDFTTGDRVPAVPSSALALACAGAALLAEALRARKTQLGFAVAIAAVVLLQVLQLMIGWGPLESLFQAPTPRVTICLALTAGCYFLSAQPLPAARLGVGLGGCAVALLAATSILDLGGDFQLGALWYHQNQLGLASGGALLLVGISRIASAWARDASPFQTRARRVALGVGAAITCVFCLLWQQMLAQDQEQLQRRVAGNQARVRIELQQQLRRALIAPLQRTADRWGVRQDTRAEQDRHAESLARDVLSLRAIGITTAEGKLGWCYPAAQRQALTEALAGRPLVATLARAIQTKAPRLTAPVGGEFWIVAPLADGRGALIGAFSFDVFLAPHVERQSEFGFGLGDREASLSGRARGWSQAVDVEVAGGVWELRVWPTPERVEAGSSALPEVSLLLGLVLASLAAALVYLALNERRRGLEALATNERLAREMAERELIKGRLAEQAVRLEAAARGLAKSNKDLEEFAYVAAHDLKTPLRAIHSLSEWIEEDLGDALQGEAKEDMALLRARVERMELLLDSLLQYSRAGRTSHEVGRLDAEKVVREAWDLLGYDEGFKLEVKGPLPTFVTARAPFEQILRNLLANAVKHHDRDQGTIRVSCEGPRQGRYVFHVSDDGPGIRAKFHERIFGMFKTLKSRDRVEGSGMGLALIKRLVTHYEGEVSVTSPLEGGRGTRFTFDWPADEAEGRTR